MRSDVITAASAQCGDGGVVCAVGMLTYIVSGCGTPSKVHGYGGARQVSLSRWWSSHCQLSLPVMSHAGWQKGQGMACT